MRKKRSTDKSPHVERDYLRSDEANVLIDTSLGALLGLGTVSEQELYTALDWLLSRQPHIEQRLASQHLRRGTLVLYDVTSSYFEGRTCPRARRGYSRDGRRDKLQIVFGLIEVLESSPDRDAAACNSGRVFRKPGHRRCACFINEKQDGIAALACFGVVEGEHFIDDAPPDKPDKGCQGAQTMFREPEVHSKRSSLYPALYGHLTTAQEFFSSEIGRCD
jgi:hypothetical protein